METGMLWFDNDPKTTLEQKIKKALDYYNNKFGNKPNVCLVHPGMLDKEKEVEGLKVRAYQPVMPGHFWIGVE
jgi:hypothetical protein